jgi:hypothetical protein
MNGATPVAPDYNMLKAALIAAQAATPTGQASCPQEEPADVREALHAVFSSDSGVASPAAALGHRFKADNLNQEDGA